MDYRCLYRHCSGLLRPVLLLPTTSLIFPRAPSALNGTSAFKPEQCFPIACRAVKHRACFLFNDEYDSDKFGLSTLIEEFCVPLRVRYLAAMRRAVLLNGQTLNASHVELLWPWRLCSNDLVRVRRHALKIRRFRTIVNASKLQNCFLWEYDYERRTDG